MRTYIREEPYSKRTGKEFSKENLLKALVNIELSFKEISFGSRKIVRPEMGSYYYEFVVQRPSQQLVESTITSYLRQNQFRNACHTSALHALSVYQADKDVSLNLEFLLNGKTVDAADEKGAYAALFKNAKRLQGTMKEWQRIANNLGFEVLKPEIIEVGNNCKVLKQCLEAPVLSEAQIAPYMIDLSRIVQKTNSKLAIDGGNGTRLEFNGHELSQRVCSATEKAIANSLDWLLGDNPKEPAIKYESKAITFDDRANYWFKRHEDGIVLGTFAAIVPIISAAIGAVSYKTISGALAGAGIGIAVDTVAAGAIFGFMAYEDWKIRRQKAAMEFKKFASQQSHLKPPQGFCIIATTESCAMKTAGAK